MARVEQRSDAAVAHELERSVADAFLEAGWEVEIEPSIGPLRPDLFLTGPKGEHLAVEVKASRAPLHFGTVAQVAEYATLAGAVQHLPVVRSVLLTTAPLSVAARDAAEKLGVLILGQEGSGRKELEPAALARYWVQCLSAVPEIAHKEPVCSASAKEVKLLEEGEVALERTLRHRRAQFKRLLIGLVVLALGIAIAFVLAKQGFGEQTHPTTITSQESGGEQGGASDSASSPLVPILIAIASLAAITVAAVIRSRRLRKRHHHSQEGAT